MNDEEIRYAIIIGINDYETSPLKFCVNDAIDLKEKLIDNCMFYDENIFMITSEDGNTIKDITGKYMESIRKIKENFRAEKDSILFYFAGHGGSKDGKSLICFQESNYPIEDIFNNISQLRPRIQTYIIDSCESGNKVLTRNKDSELKNYIKNSNGAMFLYACQNTETAQELSDLEHGLLTYKILEAIDKQSLYDEDGYLTFSRIVEYVQKEISSFSDFKQIPVMENNIIGFYPFAMKKNENDMKNVENFKEIISDDGIEILNDVRALKDIRIEIINKFEEKLNNELNSINYTNYKTNDIRDFESLQYKGVENLKKEIVEYVEECKLVPIKKIIQRKVEKRNYNNAFGAITKSIDLFNNIPPEITKYLINFESDDIKSNIRLFSSSNIREVSFAIGYICYQAKWGIVALKITFLIDWDGEEYNIIKEINIEHLALSLEKESIEIVKDIKVNFEDFIKVLIWKWNDERAEELSIYNYI